jgi:hypothetical protein
MQLFRRLLFLKMKTSTKKIRSQQHLFLMLLPLKVIPTLQQVTPTLLRLLASAPASTFDDLSEIEQPSPSDNRKTAPSSTIPAQNSDW